MFARVFTGGTQAVGGDGKEEERREKEENSPLVLWMEIQQVSGRGLGGTARASAVTFHTGGGGGSRPAREKGVESQREN